MSCFKWKNSIYGGTGLTTQNVQNVLYHKIKIYLSNDIKPNRGKLCTSAETETFVLSTVLQINMFYRYLVTSSVYFTLIGMAMVFLILAADNIDHMLKDVSTNMISFCFWIIILSVLLMPCVCFGEPRNSWFW